MELLGRSCTNTLRRLAGALACWLLAGASLPAVDRAPTILSMDGRSSATAATAALGNFVAVVWTASSETGATDVYAAVSRDGGGAFSSPARVNSTPGDVRVNLEQSPRVALRSARGQSPEMIVVWTEKGAVGPTLKTARSTDGGKTFERAVLVPGAEAAGNRGWEAMTIDDAGRAFVVWLDHRRSEPSASGTKHVHNGNPQAPATKEASENGFTRAQRSDLYLASVDGSLPPRPIAAGVCYCCKTALLPGPNGSLYVAWRHVYPGSMRDIAFTVSRDRGRTFAPPVRVSEDHWQLDGCPDDGPAMAVDRSGRIHVVWPTLVTEKGDQTLAIFHAMSADGRTFTPRQRVPSEGLARHPQIAIAPDGAPVVAWDEPMPGGRRIVTARVAMTASGVRFSREALATTASGVYPSLAATRTGLIMAWTERSGERSVIRVTTVRTQHTVNPSR